MEKLNTKTKTKEDKIREGKKIQGKAMRQDIAMRQDKTTPRQYNTEQDIAMRQHKTTQHKTM
jgi:hypothetical protein